MRLKFLIPAVLIASAVGILAFETYHKEDVPPTHDEAIVMLVGQILQQGHYDPKSIDDHFSQEVYKKYLDDLDGEKKFFLQSDISYLDKYKNDLDEEIRGESPLSFYHEADSIFDIRFKESEVIYPAVLSQPFDFHQDDSIQLDRDKLDYPASVAARKEVWSKMLKYRTLDKLLELKEMREKAKTGDTLKTASDARLEADARAKIARVYSLYFGRMKAHMSEDERFSLFVNAITSTMDPHTDYFSPVDKRYFDEQMSGTFFGIGALLRQDDDKVKIQNIVTGGPAWKEGELKAGDVILKVGQGSEEPVDLTGFTTEDAVKLIRGSKGSEVKLTVKHLDGSVKTVSIVRGEVKLEDTFARSYIINGKHKIGFIVLPEFYFNADGRTGPGSSAYDVAMEIKKLKAAQVDGIVLDLRYNGGGSLGDAVDIGGLFIPQGPVVQVRSRKGDVTVLSDRNPDIAYDGPLAVLVNEYSASASEILSAALQDYKRAVIIGSASTYGKGTVQRMVDLNDLLSGSSREKFGDLGAIKLTIQKFYRINGGSTQLKGVTPDIVLNDPYYDIAERTDKDALAWDEIPKADYTVWKKPVNVSYLEKLSEARVSQSPAFKLIDENVNVIRKINDEKTVSLNIDKFRNEQNYNTNELKKVDKLKDLMTPMNISNLKVDLPGINKDSINIDRNEELLKGYKIDPYLLEATHVLDDMISPSLNNGKLSSNIN